MLDVGHIVASLRRTGDERIIVAVSTYRLGEAWFFDGSALLRIGIASHAAERLVGPTAPNLLLLIDPKSTGLPQWKKTFRKHRGLVVKASALAAVKVLAIHP